MALPFTDLYKLQTDSSFGNRVQMAVWIASTNVLRQEREKPTDAGAQRVSWAQSQLKGTANLREVIVRITGIDTIANAGLKASDDDILAAVQQVVDDLVGV